MATRAALRQRIIAWQHDPPMPPNWHDIGAFLLAILDECPPSVAESPPQPCTDEEVMDGAIG